MLRYFVCLFLGVAACDTRDLNDASGADLTPMASEWSALEDLAQSWDLEDASLTAGGLIYSPDLLVNRLIPGALTTVTSSGVMPGQWVVTFVGQPNRTGGCGTAIPQGHQWMFGTQCLTPRNARPMLVQGGHVVADPTGTATIQKTFPATVPTGTSLQFQSVVPAGILTALSNAVTKTVTGEHLACQVSPISPDSDIVLADTGEYFIASFLCAPSGDFSPDELTLTFPGEHHIYDALRLEVGGVDYSGTLDSGGELRLTGLDDIVVDGHPFYINVHARTARHVTAQGIAYSGDSTRAVLTSVQGYGVGSGEFVEWVGAVSAQNMYLFETVPWVSQSTSSPSGERAPGIVEVLRFNVSASVRGDVVVEQVLFDLNGSGDWLHCGPQHPSLSASDFRLYDPQVVSGDIGGTWELLTSDGSPCLTTNDVLSHARVTLSEPVLVPAGSVKRFSLEVALLGALQGDAIQVSISGEGTSFVWGEASSPGISWKATLLKAFPIRGYTIWF